MTRAPLALWALLAFSAHGAPVRLLLSVGNDVGAIDDVALHHARTDAQRVRDLFVELGDVDPAAAITLLDAQAQEVMRALAALSARATALRAEGREVLLLVYVSSHARAGTLHLGGSDLSLGALRAQVEAVPAALRVLVIDACSSGAAARLKGGRRVSPATTVELEPTTRGTVVISSSGPAEPSQEWDSLTGSLFTHHWLGALRGQADADHDGRVTLLEAYGYAFRQTVAQADQHPGYDFDLKGTGEVVLSEPRRSASALSFAAVLEGRFVVASEPDARVVLEFEKSPGETMRVAVPPGPYRVRGPGRQVAFVELAAGATRGVTAGDFSSTPLAEVALKGPNRSVSLAVEASLLGSVTPRASPMAGAGAWGRVDFASGWVSLGAGFAGSSVESPTERRTDFAATLGVGAGLGVSAGPVRLGLGLVARPFLLTRLAEPVDGSVATRRTGLGLDLGPQLLLELGVGGPIFIGAQLEGLVHLSNLDGLFLPTFGWRVGLGAGFRL